MLNMPHFRAGQTAQSADLSLKTSIRIREEAQHCAVLWFSEIMHRKLYQKLGYSTMRLYALEELGLSSTRAGDFARLAGRLEDLPLLKAEMAAGRLGYSKAQEIIPVADAGNEKDWVTLAKENPRTEVRSQVQLARTRLAEQTRYDPAQSELMPRPKPTTPSVAKRTVVSFDLSPGQYARYERMMAKAGHRGGKAELLLAMAEALLVESARDESARRRAIAPPPYQVHVHECRDCEKATVQTPQGEVELAADEVAAVHCDAEIHLPGKRNKSTIPPSTRREILTRDRHQCRRKGCNHTRYLHIHHIRPRSRNGSNDADNLVTLCAGCHDLWHRQRGDLRAMLTEVPKTR